VEDDVDANINIICNISCIDNLPPNQTTRSPTKTTKSNSRSPTPLPGGDWKDLKLTSFWDCSMGCSDNGVNVMGSTQVAPINVAPMKAPEQYKKYGEDIWMVGAMSPKLLKGLEGDPVNGLNGNTGCGRYILMKGDNYAKDWTAVVMAMDQFTPGETDEVQLDQAVPGWDDHQYSKNLNNCPKDENSENYPKFHIIRDEAAEQVGNTSACSNEVFNKPCRLFSEWTGGGYDGSGTGKFKYVDCPQKLVELVSRSIVPSKQSIDDQDSIKREVLNIKN